MFSLNTTLPRNIHEDGLKDKEAVESTQKCLAAMQSRTGFFFQISF